MHGQTGHLKSTRPAFPTLFMPMSMLTREGIQSDEDTLLKGEERGKGGGGRGGGNAGFLALYYHFLSYYICTVHMYIHFSKQQS